MDTKDKLGGYVGSRRYLYDDDKPTSKKKFFSEQPIKKMADKIVDKNYQQNKDKNSFTQVAENAKNMLSFKMQDGHLENQDGQRINTVKEALKVNEALDNNFKEHKKDDYLKRIKHNSSKVISKHYDRTKLQNIPILNRNINSIAKTNPTVQRYKDFKEEKEFNKRFNEEYSDRAIEKYVRSKVYENKKAGKADYEDLPSHYLIVGEHAKDRAKEVLKAINTPTKIDTNLEEISKGISLLEKTREEMDLVNRLKIQHDRIKAQTKDDDTYHGIGSIINRNRRRED